MSATPSFIASVKNAGVTFINADGASYKTVLSAGTLGSRVDALSGTNSDLTNAKTVTVAVQLSGVDYPIGSAVIAAGAGFGSVKAVSVLDPANIPALATTEGSALFLAPGAFLRCNVVGGVTGSNNIALVAFAGDY